MSGLALKEQQQEANSLISMIERVALDQNSDITKLEKLLDMQERILNRNAHQSYTSSLAAMQSELPRVAKNGTGHNSKKYALLEDITDAIRPILQSYGFAVTFRVTQTDSKITVVTVLSHRDGHSEETSISLPSDTSGSKNAVQAVGSTISYGKRYGICAMLNISTGDDSDGEDIGLLEAIREIEAASDIKSLQSTFAASWSVFTSNEARFKLTEAKDKRKKELASGTAQ